MKGQHKSSSIGHSEKKRFSNSKGHGNSLLSYSSDRQRARWASRGGSEINTAKSHAMGVPAKSPLSDLQVVLNVDQAGATFNEATRNPALAKRLDERSHMSH